MAPCVQSPKPLHSMRQDRVDARWWGQGLSGNTAPMQYMYFIFIFSGFPGVCVQIVLTEKLDQKVKFLPLAVSLQFTTSSLERIPTHEK